MCILEFQDVRYIHFGILILEKNTVFFMQTLVCQFFVQANFVPQTPSQGVAKKIQFMPVAVAKGGSKEEYCT